MDVPLLSFACVFRPFHIDYVNHVIYVWAPCSSNVGYVHECIYPFHIYMWGVIVRATPLGAGFVDIFIGKIHSESNDQIQ